MTKSTIAFSGEPLSSTAHGSGTAFDQQFAVRDESPLWLQPILNQISQLSSLSPNWDSYGALAPNEKSIKRAQDFIGWLCCFVGIEKPDFALTASGNVTFMWEWDHGTRNLDVEIQPDGTIRFSFLDERDEEREEEGQTQDSVKILSLLTDW